MATQTLKAPSDPGDALALFQENARSHPTVVFKKSPICPVSFTAEDHYKAWIAKRAAEDQVATSVIDVIAEKPLARGLTAALDVEHQSPQLLWFEHGELRWHGSHAAITESQLDQLWNSREK
ncbi:MAG: monothiol bacilliredoxin BrxC family protein [Planctomycetota bacterium]